MSTMCIDEVIDDAIVSLDAVLTMVTMDVQCDRHHENSLRRLKTVHELSAFLVKVDV